MCVVQTSVQSIRKEQCSQGVIPLTKQHSFISSEAIRQHCGRAERFRLRVNTGQTMNVSVWSFDTTSQSRGRLRDPLSGNSADIKTSSRFQHVLTSLGNEIEVSLPGLGDNNQQNYLLDIHGKFPCRLLRLSSVEISL